MPISRAAPLDPFRPRVEVFKRRPAVVSGPSNTGSTRLRISTGALGSEAPPETPKRNQGSDIELTCMSSEIPGSATGSTPGKRRAVGVEEDIQLLPPTYTFTLKERPIEVDLGFLQLKDILPSAYSRLHASADGITGNRDELVNTGPSNASTSSNAPQLPIPQSSVVEPAHNVIEEVHLTQEGGEIKESDGAVEDIRSENADLERTVVPPDN